MIVHVADNATKELIIRKIALAISVPNLKQAVRVLGRDANTEVMDGLLELILAKGTRFVFVFKSKRASNAHNATFATLN